MLKKLRAVLYSAQLDFGRALAVVRLTCSKEVVDAAENLRIAIMDFEQESREKGEIAIETGSTPDATDPRGDRLPGGASRRGRETSDVPLPAT